MITRWRPGVPEGDYPLRLYREHARPRDFGHEAFRRWREGKISVSLYQFLGAGEIKKKNGGHLSDIKKICFLIVINFVYYYGCELYN